MKNALTLVAIGALAAAYTLTVAAPAQAGCQSIYVLGGYRSTCDGPVRPDGTWDRCDGGGFGGFGGGSSCFPMGGPLGTPPGHQPGHIYP